MSITNLARELFSLGCHITLTFVALYISYIHGCKIASQIRCIVSTNSFLT